MILGIDPGLGGALAFLHHIDDVLLEPMPLDSEKQLDLVELNRLISSFANQIDHAFLEKVSAMPGQGVCSMFKFGYVFGVIQGILVANKIPFTLVRPQVWQKKMHPMIESESKVRSRLAFENHFPGISALKTARSKVPDMGLMEAALIAKYGYQQTYNYFSEAK